MSLLEVDDVHSYYGESHILRGVSLSVNRGETVALIGRNGVGKTTTLRSVLQLTPPRRGTVSYDGVDVTGRPTHEVARMGVGWVPEERRMFSHLTVDENLRIATPPGESVEAAFETARMPMSTGAKSGTASTATAAVMPRGTSGWSRRRG